MARESIFDYVERKVDEAKKHIKNGRRPDEFPEELKILFLRWNKACTALTTFQNKPQSKILVSYMTWLMQDGISIDERTAREDLYAARLLYPDITGMVRETERLLDLALMKDAAHKALAEGKFGDFAKIMRVRAMYLDPRFDPIETKDSELEENFNIMPAFAPEVLGIEDASFSDINKQRAKMLQRKKTLAEKLDDFVEPEEIKLEDDRTS